MTGTATLDTTREGCKMTMGHDDHGSWSADTGTATAEELSSSVHEAGWYELEPGE